MAGEAGGQFLRGRAVGVTVHQQRRAGLVHPLHGGASVEIGPGLRPTVTLLLLHADRADLGGQRTALGQRPRQEVLAGLFGAHDGAEALVLHVFQAQRVTVRQQHPLAEGPQHRRIGQGRHAALLQQFDADQEVAVACHEGHAASRGGFLQHLDDLVLEALMPGVVADPYLEQVAENEHRLGARVQQVLRERLKGEGMARLQVQVGDEVDRPPFSGRLELPELRQRRGHAGAPGRCGRRRGHRLRAPQATSFARVITTSSSGTSSWPPWRPVFTRSIASTTSVPATTLPNTA
ncbi:hypothetical protein Y694_04162 [Methylibium sp. T29-B]|nr:hypothetical protein Y694_04162 [Methylibium sp. T29-B]